MARFRPHSSAVELVDACWVSLIDTHGDLAKVEQPVGSRERLDAPEHFSRCKSLIERLGIKSVFAARVLGVHIERILCDERKTVPQVQRDKTIVGILSDHEHGTPPTRLH
jgi:hypothetical protein